MTLEALSPRAAAERTYQNNRMVHADFNMAPFTIAWEVTRACAYAAPDLDDPLDRTEPSRRARCYPGALSRRCDLVAGAAR